MLMLQKYFLHQGYSFLSFVFVSIKREFFSIISLDLSRVILDNQQPIIQINQIYNNLTNIPHYTVHGLVLNPAFINPNLCYLSCTHPTRLRCSTTHIKPRFLTVPCVLVAAATHLARLRLKRNVVGSWTIARAHIASCSLHWFCSIMAVPCTSSMLHAATYALGQAPVLRPPKLTCRFAAFATTCPTALGTTPASMTPSTSVLLRDRLLIRPLCERTNLTITADRTASWTYMLSRSVLYIYTYKYITCGMC